jgi:hypothetical protein
VVDGMIEAIYNQCPAALVLSERVAHAVRGGVQVCESDPVLVTEFIGNFKIVCQEPWVIL